MMMLMLIEVSRPTECVFWIYERRILLLGGGVAEGDISSELISCLFYPVERVPRLFSILWAGGDSLSCVNTIRVLEMICINKH